MKVVIDIPEYLYKEIVNDEEYGIERVRKSVINGTLLPKGHGRLIDEEEILRELGSYHIGGLDAIKNYNGENTWADGLHTAWAVIDDAETIIEADKESEDSND